MDGHTPAGTDRGGSKRQILRETGMHWTTLEKILAHPSPPGYRLEQFRPQPKIGPYLDRIAEILDADKSAPKKQRHTVKRIFERIREKGYTDGYTQVKGAVRHGAVTRDVIAQYLIPAEDIRQSVFLLDGRPHLRHVQVAPNSVTVYAGLMGGGT